MLRVFAHASMNIYTCLGGNEKPAVQPEAQPPKHKVKELNVIYLEECKQTCISQLFTPHEFNYRIRSIQLNISNYS